MSDVTKDLTPETQARIVSLQGWIADKGIKDIAFARDTETWNESSYETRAKDICNLLEAVRDGKCGPLPPLGDSVRIKPAQQEIFDVYMKERGLNANT